MSASIVLSDGRKLGYAEFGDPRGTPVLWFPGLPGCCRYAHPGDVEVTRRCGVRLVVVERPGFGISDFKPGRRLLDYANDVVELADALAIERFCIGGVSAGGPSLLACAHALPERVIAVGLIGCGGPPDAPGALEGMAPARKRFAAIYRHAPRLAADDRSTPIGMGRYMAQTIPTANARFLPGEGHFICADRWEEILRAITRHAAGSLRS